MFYWDTSVGNNGIILNMQVGLYVSSAFQVLFAQHAELQFRSGMNMAS